MQSTAPSNGKLLHNLLLFGRLLRALGMDVNPGRMIDLVDALAFVEIGKRSDFYYTARSLLVHDQADLALFDQAFDLFWQKPEDEEGYRLPMQEPGPEQSSQADVHVLPQPQPDAQEEAEDVDESKNEEEEEEDGRLIELTRTFSQRELLRQKDFGNMSPEELNQVKQFMADLAWELGTRRTRRRKASRRGRHLDLRRSLRRNLRYGGELLEWPRRQQKEKPRPLIIIADISGSMEQYTKLLLHFIYSLAEGLDQQVEAFVFSTRLTRITRQLRGRDLERALNDVAQEVHDWAGGTRIGDSIKTFNFEWGRRVLGRGAVVLLISDGWDRGDPKLLHNEMGRLRRSCHRLVWLNPLLGSDRYEPLTRGMQAALPNIDDFLPVHNLASLEDLATHLAGLTVEKRPFRPTAINLSGAAFVGKR